MANGTISALIRPAWPRLARRSAPDGRLPEVTASLDAAGSISAIVGAMVGGVVVSSFGAEWAFLINAASYLPLFYAIRRVPDAAAESSQATRAVRTGIELVRRTDVLRRSFVLLAAVLSLAACPVVSVLPAVASDIESKAHVLGILLGAFYAGAATVSFVTARLGRRFTYGRVRFVGFLGVGGLLDRHHPHPAHLFGWDLVHHPGGVEDQVTTASTPAPATLAT